MEAKEFERLLTSAVLGNKDDIESILKMYEPLINRNSFLNGKIDEDLRQYILMHIIKNISKFKI